VLELTEDKKKQLERIIQRYTSPYYIVARAKIVLLAAQGFSNLEIAGKMDLPRQIVSKWRKRFFEKGIGGLQDLPRSGRPVSKHAISPKVGRQGAETL
jgi:transposase-like protein